MKSKLLISSLIGSALFAAAGMVAPAMAQYMEYSQGPQSTQSTYTPMIDRAQREIDARIEQGVESGRITRDEAQRLYQREREIGERASRYKADGYASAAERQQLRLELDALRADVESAIANPRAAASYERTPGIDRREAALRERIEDGVRDGRIDEREARRLYRLERRIERDELRAKADGVVTWQERRQLRRELADLNEDLERALNNYDDERDDRYAR
ncbi:MAG: hypothetical protein H7Z39_08285 [Burkholderiaceae bacterium]|nr:hypothetical protein [Burkholderiaceae bacterium]